MEKDLPNFLYEEKGIIKLKPGVMAHRLGIIEDPIPAKKRTQYSILENITEDSLSPYCSSYLSVNITNSLGENQSINDSKEGSYAKYGWDIKTNKYGKKKLSLIFNDKLNQELRAKDKAPDAMLEKILDRSINKYGDKLRYLLDFYKKKKKALKEWEPTFSGFYDFFEDEINKNFGIKFKECRSDDGGKGTLIAGMILTHVYEKFRNGNFNEKERLLEEVLCDPMLGLRAYRINDNLETEPLKVDTNYIDAFAFCKQIRKNRVKTEIKYKPMGRLKDIPIYLIS